MLTSSAANGSAKYSALYLFLRRCRRPYLATVVYHVRDGHILRVSSSCQSSPLRAMNVQATAATVLLASQHNHCTLSVELMLLRFVQIVLIAAAGINADSYIEVSRCRQIRTRNQCDCSR